MAETIWADDMAAMLCRALFLAAWSWGDMGREDLSRATSQAQGRMIWPWGQKSCPVLGTRFEFVMY